MSGTLGRLASVADSILNGIPKVVESVTKVANIIASLRGETNPIGYIPQDGVDKINHVNEMVKRYSQVMGGPNSGITPPAVTAPEDITAWIQTIAPIVQSFNDWLQANVVDPSSHVRLIGGTYAIQGNMAYSSCTKKLNKTLLAAKCTDAATFQMVDNLGGSLMNLATYFPFRDVDTLEVEAKSASTAPAGYITSSTRQVFSNVIAEATVKMAPSACIAPYNDWVPTDSDAVWVWERAGQDFFAELDIQSGSEMIPPSDWATGTLQIPGGFQSMGGDKSTTDDISEFEPYYVGDPGVPCANFGHVTTCLEDVDNEEIDYDVLEADLPKSGVWKWMTDMDVTFKLDGNLLIDTPLLGETSTAWIGVAYEELVDEVMTIIRKWYPIRVRSSQYPPGQGGRCVVMEATRRIPIPLGTPHGVYLSVVWQGSIVQENKPPVLTVLNYGAFELTCKLSDPKGYLIEGNTIPFSAISYRMPNDTKYYPLPSADATYLSLFGVCDESLIDDPVCSVNKVWEANVDTTGNYMNRAILAIDGIASAMNPPLDINAKYEAITGVTNQSILDFVPVQKWTQYGSIFTGLNAQKKANLILTLFDDMENFSDLICQSKQWSSEFDKITSTV